MIFFLFIFQRRHSANTNGLELKAQFSLVCLGFFFSLDTENHPFSFLVVHEVYIKHRLLLKGCCSIPHNSHFTTKS